jgi:hypothetical protein
VYSTNCENSSALNGSPWGSGATPPYDYYCKVDSNAMIAGNTLVVSFGADLAGGDQTWSITDDKGDSFSSIVTSSTSNNRGLTIYYASNIAGGESYIDVRLVGGTLNGYWQPTIAEFDNTGAVDASSCNTGNSTSITAGTLTAMVPGDLFYQVAYYPNLTYGTAAQSAAYSTATQSGVAWKFWYQDLGDGAAGQWGVDSGTSSINPTFTAPRSQTFASCAVAFQAVSAGGPSSDKLIDHERSALPKNGPNPWKMAMNVTGYTVIVTYLSNDAPNPATCCAISSSPALTWTQSGPDGAGTNGHNHADVYCAHSSSPIGLLTISINRAGTANDGIFHIYDLDATTSCAVDFDSGASSGTLTLAGQKNSGSTINMCADAGQATNCLTPSSQNDFIVGNLGEYWGTITSITSPSWMIDDAAYFTGNTVDGYTQTDENNAFFHGSNDTSLTSFTVSTRGVYTGGAPYPYYWAARVVGFKPAP